MPSTRPRYRAPTYSLMSTAPAAHSPPKPKPCTQRSASSDPKPVANPTSAVARAYHAMVTWSTLTRPQRSEAAPASHPPSAVQTNVTEASSPP